MLFKLWDTLVGYLQRSRYWSAIEPYVAVISLWMMAEVLAYEYIKLEYHLELPLRLFARSPLALQVVVLFIGAAIVVPVLRLRRGAPDVTPPPGATPDAAAVAPHPRLGWTRIGLVALVVAAVAAAFGALSPHEPTNIRVRVLAHDDGDPNSFKSDALVYLLYEINKRQPAWHFDIDFRLFSGRELTDAQQKECAASDDTPLCFAHALAGNESFIGITDDSLGINHFLVNDGAVSVISARGWPPKEKPSVYEFLAYSVITQSILIHLNARCRGLPALALSPSRTSYGDFFQFAPRRSAMRAELLAAHLDPAGEALLLNCFGPEYLGTVRALIDLSWLRTDPVKANLRETFQVP